MQRPHGRGQRAEYMQRPQGRICWGVVGGEEPVGLDAGARGGL